MDATQRFLLHLFGGNTAHAIDNDCNQWVIYSVDDVKHSYALSQVHPTDGVVISYHSNALGLVAAAMTICPIENWVLYEPMGGKAK